jgi:hypothetical protein
MCAALDNLGTFEHQNLIVALNSRRPVCDNEVVHPRNARNPS